MKLLLLTTLLIGNCLSTSADAAQIAYRDSSRFIRTFSTGGITSLKPKNPGKPAQRWAKLWTEKQLDAVTAMYAADAVFLTGQGARITGRDAIRALFKTAFDAVNPDLKVKSIVIEQSGNLAYDSGEYTETLTPVGGGAKRKGKGNYVMVLKRQRAGNWLIIQHVWTDVPSEPAKQ
jgi:uncharacterized protein (TIGR02246 family)